MDRRVVITGVACISPLGIQPCQVWDALVAGQSGVGPITLFDASSFPVRIAAEVNEWDVQKTDLGDQISDYDRQTQFAIAAAWQAGRRAGFKDAPHDPSRIGVYLGCGEIFPNFAVFSGAMEAAFDDDEFSRGKFSEGFRHDANPTDEFLMEPGAGVPVIAGLFDAQGPSANYLNACVSSSTAIGEATCAIRRDEADVMLAGGAHSMIHPFGITGLHRLSALSTRNEEPSRASRPFDRDRDGFVVGEGGAVFVLEELQHARRRGAEIWVELRGYGATHDAFHITHPRPDGRGAANCIRRALDDAQLNPEDIDYVNAHGSSTTLNDKVETAAIKTALGDHAHKVAISSTKSMTGHLTTACGAMELFVCMKAIKEGVVPPTINHENIDPDCDLDYVPNEARAIACSHALNNTFGFGGHNACLIVSKVED